MSKSAPVKKNTASSHSTGYITPQIEATILQEAALDPVALQYLPSAAEDIIQFYETADPIGDHPNSPVEGLVHRHPDRVLLKITDICAVYCRFCFRKEMVGKGGGILTSEQLDKAIRYIEAHPEIHEVILTGGDPLTLSNRRMGELMSRLEAIAHLDIIRFHTRTPVVQPNRIDDDFIALINNSPKALYMVLHINHAQEIDDKVIAMLDRLSRSRMTLLSQSVLLKNINDNVEALEHLFRRLVANSVKPYYLHHPDLAPGTGHFRVSISKGQNLMKELENRLSGLCLPNYVLDIPGGFGKISLEESNVYTDDGINYTLKDFRGQDHQYRDYRTEEL